MQRVNTKAVIIVTIIIAFLGGLWAFRESTPSEKPLADQTKDERVMTIRARFAEAASMVRVVSPAENGQVGEPLKVTGFAKEEWYARDKTFQIELHDQQGNILTTALASVSGEGSDGFVPFTAVITYVKPATDTVGKLVFKKANPSGDPEKDREYAQSVSF